MRFLNRLARSLIYEDIEEEIREALDNNNEEISEEDTAEGDSEHGSCADSTNHHSARSSTSATVSDGPPITESNASHTATSATSESNESVASQESDTVYTLGDLVAMFFWICERVTWTHLVDISNHIGIVWTAEEEAFYYNICLNPCGYDETEATSACSGEEGGTRAPAHLFDETRRCSRCCAQLCKDCEQCIFQHCLLITNPSTAPELERGDSLAAARIFSSCSRLNCNPDRRLPRNNCECSQHLMDTEHDCGEGKFHFCLRCLLVLLGDFRVRENVLVTTFKAESEGLEDEDVQTYACACGHPADYTKGHVCWLCEKACHPVDLNENWTLGGGKAKLGWTNDFPVWNYGRCPWFLLSPEEEVEEAEAFVEGSEGIE